VTTPEGPRTPRLLRSSGAFSTWRTSEDAHARCRTDARTLLRRASAARTARSQGTARCAPPVSTRWCRTVLPGAVLPDQSACDRSTCAASCYVVQKRPATERPPVTPEVSLVRVGSIEQPPPIGRRCPCRDCQPDPPPPSRIPRE
jgi:hypothetical protein